jgi:methyl-accepting chemotaxis protein
MCTSAEKVASSVKEQVVPLEETTETLKDVLDSNRDTIRVSNEHVRNLKEQADRLDDTFEYSRGVSESAIAAATAYQKITDALNEAHTQAQQANENSKNATVMVSPRVYVCMYV